MARDRIPPDLHLAYRDGNGLPEDVGLRIHLAPGCGSPVVLAGVCDLCAAIGFGAGALHLPLVDASSGDERDRRRQLDIGLAAGRSATGRRKQHAWAISADDEASLAARLRSAALRHVGRGATRTRSGHVHPAEEQPALSEAFTRFPYRLALLAPLELDAAVAVANFATRLGLEALSLTLPFAVPGHPPSDRRPSILIGRRADALRLARRSPSGGLAAAWDSGLLLLDTRRRWPDVLVYGEDAALVETLAFLTGFPLPSDGWEAPWLRDASAALRGLARPARATCPAPRPPAVLKYRLADEREEILAAVRQAVARRSAGSAQVDITIARPLAARRRFARRLGGLLTRYAARAEVRVLNAYKPGLSWLTEVVAPQLEGQGVTRVEIAFREFRGPGLEEPLRWLQELYPADELLARRLALPPERIRRVTDNRLDAAYRVRAWRGSRQLCDARYSPHYAAWRYLPDFPRAGRVHPTTGWLRLVVDGEPVLDQRVETPLDRAWKIYQDEILPRVAKEAAVALARSDVSRGPLFEELRFDLAFDYPAERLGVDEERVSPLEALHEDLYFVTLDYVARWLRQHRAAQRSAGRILPVVRSRPAATGSLTFTLVHRSGEDRRAEEDGKIRLHGLALRAGAIELGLAVDAPVPGERAAWTRRLGSAPGIRAVIGLRGPGPLLVILSAGAPTAGSRPHRAAAPPRVPLDRPLGYAESVRLMRAFTGVPGARVREEAKSFGGLPVYSLELTEPGAAPWVSHLKRRLRPTLFINCRHHANEVSSTNAGLELARRLTGTSLRALLRAVNVVLNPLENADGVVTGEALLRLTPTDKLHAARYNAAGQEYYAEYFDPNTLFGEATVKPALWRRWLPDLCLDSHGFPSHEWEQPFAGYAPARFRDFWIPRALIYVYLSHLEADPRGRVRRNAEFLRGWLLEALSAHPAVRERNARFAARYWRYRQAWIGGRPSPDAVPCLPLAPRLRPYNYAYRAPAVTTAELITEVADETARGDYLRVCVSAHLEADLALIRLLNGLSIRAKKFRRSDGRATQFLWHRARPLVFRLPRREGGDR